MEWFGVWPACSVSLDVSGASRACLVIWAGLDRDFELDESLLEEEDDTVSSVKVDLSRAGLLTRIPSRPGITSDILIDGIRSCSALCGEAVEEADCIRGSKGSNGFDSGIVVPLPWPENGGPVNEDKRLTGSLNCTEVNRSPALLELPLPVATGVPAELPDALPLGELLANLR